MKLSILLCVGLIATLGAVSAKSASTSVGQCSKEDEGVTYGVPSDCHQYIVCKKGNLELKKCESKYDYDTVTSKCVKSKNATCAVEEVPEEPQPVEPVPEEPQETDEQYDYLCVKVLYGVRIHPNACDKYLVCSKEKATIEYCDDGFIFVADAIQCVRGNKATCSIEQAVPSTTQEPPTPEAKEDGSEEDVDGSEDIGESSKESEGKYDYLCAKKLLGSVAHPESCTKYISCKLHKAKEENCKKGYSYSSKLGLCVKQSNGECADAPQNPPATTEAPSTVTKPNKPDSGESNSGDSSKKPDSGESNSGDGSETSEGEYDYLCAKKLLGSVAHPESCTKYISCVLYKAKEENCKKGYSYSSKLGLCVKQSNGDCADAPENPPATTEAPSTVTKPNKPDSGESNSGENSGSSAGKYGYVCENVADGKYPHPDSCTKYITCKKHKAKEESCKKGSYYAANLKTCIKGSQEDCAGDNGNPDTPTTLSPATETTTTPPPTETTTLPPTTKTTTLAPATETATPPPTTKTTTLPPTTEKTTPPPTTTVTEPDSGESNSGDGSETSEGEYDYLCAKKLLGSVAHPESCTKYISCKLHKAKEENCKKGYSYSSKLGLCVKQSNGDCADAPENPPATTEAPSTVTKPNKPDSGESNSGENSGSSAGKYGYVCENVTDGKYPHPDSCTKYITCKKHKAKEESCKKGSYYAANLKTCIKGSQEACAGGNGNPETPTTLSPATETTTTPPPTETTTLPPTTKTTTLPPATETTTPPPTTKTTTLPPATETTTPPPTTTVTEPDSGESNSGDGSETSEGEYDYLCAKKLLGSVAHPESCTKYISCVLYKAKEENCKKGYSYSSKLGLCVKQSNGDCADAPENPPATTEAPTTVTKPNKPDSGESNSGENSGSSAGKYGYVCENVTDGKYPHPDSCTKYITCKKHKAKEESCKKGSYYAANLKTCIKGSQEACAGGNGNPDTPTTLSPATETTTTPPPTETTTLPPTTKTTTLPPATETTTPPPTTITTTLPPATETTTPRPTTITTTLPPATETTTPRPTTITTTLPPATETTTPPPTTITTTLPPATETTTPSPTTTTTALPPTTEPTTPQPTTTTTTLPPVTETTTTPPVSVTLGPSFPAETTTAEAIPEITPPASGGDPTIPIVECVQGFTGYLPIENDCTKYVYCSQGEPGQRSCLEEYIYYDPLKACLPGDPVLCQLYSL